MFRGDALHSGTYASSRVPELAGLKWKFSTKGKIVSSPAVVDYAKLYPDITIDGMMIGLSRMYTLGSVLSSPVVVDGTVFFGSTDGNVYAVR